MKNYGRAVPVTGSRAGGHISASTSANRGVTADATSQRGGPHKYYCKKCGYTWYADSLAVWRCPKTGCGGEAERMSAYSSSVRAVGRPGGRAKPPASALPAEESSGGRRGSGFPVGRVVAILAIIAAIVTAILWLCRSGGEVPAEADVEHSDGDMSAVIIRMDEKEKAEALSAVPEAFREKVGQYLFPTGEEIYEWFKVVHDSDYVQNNAAYKAFAANTRFRYNESTNEVNAFASRWDDLTEETHANLNFFGGFVRFTRVIGAVMASGSLAGTNSPPRWSLLEDKVSLYSDELSAKDALALLAECGIAPEWFLNDAFVQEARNIANGIGMSVAGHEMGHIAYGHIWRTGDINAETSRNKERDADSFSFSVSSEEKTYAMGSISRYMFIGNVCLMVAWTNNQAMMVDALAKKRGVSTPEGLEALRAEIMLTLSHPFAGERLLNLLTSKEGMAKQYGLDVAQISAILHEHGIH